MKKQIKAIPEIANEQEELYVLLHNRVLCPLTRPKRTGR